jgi:hypothetical protein
MGVGLKPYGPEGSASHEECEEDVAWFRPRTGVVNMALPYLTLPVPDPTRTLPDQTLETRWRYSTATRIR